jgi:AbrB family looped-hinge helix DNA binding protein
MVVIPARLRRLFGLTEGSLVLVEATADALMIRPAVAVPVETYTPERKAAFLLESAVDKGDYARAVKDVRRMGIEPSSIPHKPPRN